MDLWEGCAANVRFAAFYAQDSSARIGFGVAPRNGRAQACSRHAKASDRPVPWIPDRVRPAGLRWSKRPRRPVRFAGGGAPGGAAVRRRVRAERSARTSGVGGQALPARPAVRSAPSAQRGGRPRGDSGRMAGVAGASARRANPAREDAGRLAGTRRAFIGLGSFGTRMRLAAPQGFERSEARRQGSFQKEPRRFFVPEPGRLRRRQERSRARCDGSPDSAAPDASILITASEQPQQILWIRAPDTRYLVVKPSAAGE